MRKIFSIFALAFLLTPLIVLAHPGDLDSYNCHTCYTNCTTWGLSYGKYHCHNPEPVSYDCYIPKAYCSQTLLDSYYQYKQQAITRCSRYGTSEIDCGDVQNWEQKITQCKQDIQDYNTAMQTYNDCEARNSQLFKEWALLIIEQKISPIEKTLNCPTNSTYENGTCSCNFSMYYNKETNVCQTLEEYCKGKLGENGHFKSFSGKLPDIDIQCECNNGYTKNSSGQCIKIETSSCPINSSGVNGRCLCDDGYTANDAKNSCILIPKLETPKTGEISVEQPTIVQEKKQAIKISAIQQASVNTTVVKENVQKTEDKISTSTIETAGKYSFVNKITQSIKNIFINVFKKIKFW